MHIVRLLLRSPILLMWTLAFIAILLSWIVGGKAPEHGQEAKAKHAPAAEHAKGKPEHAPEVAMHGMSGMAGMSGMSGQTVVAEQQPAVPVATQPASAQTGMAGNVQVVQDKMAPPPAPTTAPDDVLLAAREAYWNDDLKSSIEFYKTLVQKAPDSLQYKGELANVYWKHGDAQQAANLFAEIAPKLATAGRTTEAFNMKLYIYMVDPALAKSIDADVNK